MDTSTEQDLEDSLKAIRKLRKKLRQIERLEKNQRELTEEEKVKLSCKHDIRSSLQLMLSKANEADVSLDSIKSEDDREEEEEEQHDIASTRNKLPRENTKAAPLNRKHVRDGAAKVEDTPLSKQEKANLWKNIQKEDEKAASLNEKDSGDGESSTERKRSSDGPAKVDETPLSKKAKEKKVQNTRSTLRRFWRNSTFHFKEMEGHNEAVCCVDTTDTWIISGSRDTTLKLWDVMTGEEVKSMGGHTGQVTTVNILTQAASDYLRKNIDRSTIEVFTDIDERRSDNERVAVSGSTDCSIRLWLLPKGLFIKSIYNYNSISSMAYIDDLNFLIVGSSSGNLTVQNLCSNSQVFSSTIHSSAITDIQTWDSQIVTASANGSIKVWKIQQNLEEHTKPKQQGPKKLKFSVASEDFDILIQHSFEEHAKHLSERHIHCIFPYKGTIIFGDDGTNVKIWNPISGELKKLRNHKQNVPGISDHVTVIDQLLVTSSYDMDCGVGSLNVRSLHPDCYGAYIASFSHCEVPRICTFSMQFEQEPKVMVTGGDKLLLWRFEEPGKTSTGDGATPVKGQNTTEISAAATDSDVQSDVESSAGEDEGRWFWQKTKSKASEVQPDNADRDDSDSDADESHQNDSLVNNSGFSIWDWCSII